MVNFKVNKYNQQSIFLRREMERRRTMEDSVVKVVKGGESTFVFHDAYCRNTTPEEVEATLNRIAAIALPGLKPSCPHKEDSA